MTLSTAALVNLETAWHGSFVPLSPEEVGRRIREARIAKGWTVEELARQMGVNWRTVTRWQTGVDQKTGKPTLPRVTGEKSLLRLAEVLEVPVSWLVESEDEQATLEELTRQVAGLAVEIGQLRTLVGDALADGQGPERADDAQASTPQRRRSETA